jgi:transcriptional regulator with XRE-family HTH domain
MAANHLGDFLKASRARLDPTDFGFSAKRRRTPGLRREEVAQRADVSATWYTWLEQGRGGAPSSEVLDAIARALALTSVEREHLFLLAQHRPPEVRYQAFDGVSPRLQNVLDGFELSPALIRTPTWDFVAWNRAARAVLGDYEALPPQQRNLLRLLFLNPEVREGNRNWENHARFAVAAFRLDTTRAGASHAAQALADELCRTSPEFNAMWHENDVRTHVGAKQLHHPIAGIIGLEYSSFAVDSQSDLIMVVFTPATPADADRIRSLL